MAMIALARLFLLKMRVEHEASAPMWSAYADIVELLAFYLPRRRRNEEEVISGSGQEAPTTPDGRDEPRPTPAEKASGIVTK